MTSTRSDPSLKLRELVAFAVAAFAADLSVLVARIFVGGRYDLKARAAGALAAHAQRLRDQVTQVECGSGPGLIAPHARTGPDGANRRCA